MLATPSAPPAERTYPAIYLSDNAQAVLGDVHGLNSGFFRNQDPPDRKALLLKSLYYDGMRSRHEQISRSAGSPRLVDWIWKTTFPQWLESSEAARFYWITGLPGSGKSTLMKHLAESRKTSQLLERSGEKWTVISFFFDFGAGEHTSNQLEGMLRSLFYQLLRKVRGMANEVDTDQFGEDLGELNVQDSMNALCDAVESISIRVCVFIDGLDEFRGSSSKLMEVVYGLEVRAGMKIVLACRPEPIFASQLSSFPHLTMQDHNDDSIRQYTEAEWISRRIDAHSRLPQALSDKVRKMACGVFLWARIAVDELLQGYLDGKSVRELDVILDQMPKQVETMYEATLNRLSPVLQTEAAVLIHLLLDAEGYCKVRKLYTGIYTLIKKLHLEAQLLPVDIDADNEYRVTAILGGMIDVVMPEDGHDCDSAMDDDTIEPCAKPRLAYVNSRICLRRGPRSRIRLNHKTLYTFFETTSWLSDHLPPALKTAYLSDIWLRLHVEEVIGLETDGRCTEMIRKQVQKYAIDIAEPAWNITPPHVEQRLVNILSIWPKWSPLLAYTVQDLPGLLRTYGEIIPNDLVDDIAKSLSHPVSLLHYAFCLFRYRDASPTGYYISYVFSCAHVYDVAEMRTMMESGNPRQRGLAVATGHGLSQVVKYMNGAVYGRTQNLHG